MTFTTDERRLLMTEGGMSLILVSVPGVLQVPIDFLDVSLLLVVNFCRNFVFNKICTTFYFTMTEREVEFPLNHRIR